MRDVETEEQEGDEIEEGRPRDRLLGRKHTGGHDCGNRIGRVMKPIERIEDERNRDERH
jgi:hypothetical protein